MKPSMKTVNPVHLLERHRERQYFHCGRRKRVYQFHSTRSEAEKTFTSLHPPVETPLVFGLRRSSFGRHYSVLPLARVRSHFPIEHTSLPGLRLFLQGHDPPKEPAMRRLPNQIQHIPIEGQGTGGVQ